MLTRAGSVLRRLLALLAATAGLSQGLQAYTDRNGPAQFPDYAALTAEQAIYTEDAYVGPNALILLENCGPGEGSLESAYVCAEIYVPDVHNLRTYYMESEENGLGGEAGIMESAKHVGAAFAVNGDFYSSYAGKTAVRNGKQLGNFVSSYDLCVLYEDGEMKTFRAEDLKSYKTLSQVTENAWQAWSFGPVLLEEDGSAIESFAGRVNEFLRERHPRTAIGYYGPGHYCLLTVSGYQWDSPGATLEELSRFFAERGCLCAYNLDGGDSTHVWFHGKEIGRPSDSRTLADLIYVEEKEP